MGGSKYTGSCKKSYETLKKKELVQFGTWGDQMAADTTRLLFLAQRAPVFLPGTRQTLKGDPAGKTTDRLTEQQHTNR